MATAQEALDILTRMATELEQRRTRYQERQDGYDGNHPLKMASPQYQAFFAQRYEGFSDNWMQVVPDAPVERLEVTGIRLPGTDTAVMDREGDRDLWQDWLRQEADYTSDMAFLEATVQSRAYGMVWGTADGEPIITFETSDQCIVAYDPETRDRVAGLKMFQDGRWQYANLILADGVYKWQRRIGNDVTAQLWVPVNLQTTRWEPRQVAGEPWPMPNPLGEVFLVELPNRPRLRAAPMSDIDGPMSMQNAINLFWAYLLNAGDFASFPQRVILGAERPKMPVLNEAGNVVGTRDVPLEKFAVNRVVWLEDPNAKIGEWSAANLELYTSVLEVMVGHIASQTRTPHHYFLGKMANVSAEALKAAETGLVKRTEEKTKSFGRGIREMFRLVALVRGDLAKADQIRSAEVVWKDIESRSEAQQVDAALKLRSMGYPLEYISRRLGMTPSEIVDVMDMVRREQELDPVGALTRLAGQANNLPALEQ